MKGIHKAISRSTTPAGARAGPDGHYVPGYNPYTPGDGVFQSPRLPVKRKVSAEHDLSPNSKHRKAALEASFTPKVVTRARSVSIKSRFRRKKSLTSGAHDIPGVSKFKEPSLVIHFDANASSGANNAQLGPPRTPRLPSKPNINVIMATPKTPDFLDTGLPSSGQDLSADNLEENASFDEVDGAKRRSRRKSKSNSPMVTRSEANSARSSRTSLASVDSVASTKSYPGRVVKRRASDLTGSRKHFGKPRSPSERKIGVVRRRSQEMARKESLRREQDQRRDKNRVMTKPLPVLDESYLRSQLKRGKPNTFRYCNSARGVAKRWFISLHYLQG